MKYDVNDLKLAPKGKRRILWADHDMPVLQCVRERFEKELPLKGLRMSACLHVTAETANLARTLKAGGADLLLCASNPLSTQDDVASSLVEDFGIPVFAIRGEDNETYYRHIKDAIDHNPEITMDDGADLVSAILTDHPNLHDKVIASMEETTTGIIRLKAMERDGVLKFPVIAVNDAQTKHMFDNRYGTGQSTLDGIIRATDILLAGTTVVVVGYGWCGRGVSSRARGMGANVIVTEVDPIKALEAHMDGFRVMPLEDATGIGNIFVTVTGNKHVLREAHFQKMQDGAIIANSGHFNVEIDIPTLENLSSGKREIREHMQEYKMRDGRRILLLGEGRLINLSAAEGHPASVMDMSFANQALSVEHLSRNASQMDAKVHMVPEKIDGLVAKLKLESLGLRIDNLTKEQKTYLESWSEGT